MSFRIYLKKGRSRPVGSISPDGKYKKVADGNWVHVSDPKAPRMTGAELFEKLKSEAEDSYEMYADVASGTPDDKWASYMKKFGFDEGQSLRLKEYITNKEKDTHREQATEQFEKEKRLAFEGRDFATGSVHSIPEKDSPVDTDKGLEKFGRMLGGLSFKYPAVKKILNAGLVNGIVRHTQSGKSGHSANYNPSTRKIEINDPYTTTAGVLLHEIGHALEEIAPDGWMQTDGWGHGQKSASLYTQGNPSEQFAEAFVTLVADEDPIQFRQHAPKQAKLIAECLRKLSS